MSKKPSIQPTTRIDRFKMAQLSCSFATNCRTKCCFSRAGQGRQQLIPLNSWVYNIKKKHLRDVNVSQRCVSSEKKLILACIGLLRRPRFHDMPQISCTTCCEILTFGFVNASILSGITGQYSGEPIRMKYLAHVTRINQSDFQISTFHSIRHL